MPLKNLDARKEYHREYNREYMKVWRKENNTYAKQRETLWRERNPERRLLASTRQSAKLKGLEHTITKEDIVIPKICPYLGITIDTSAGNGKRFDSPSVDRVDNSKGYTKDNIEVISNLANTMKNKATKEQLVSFAQRIMLLYDSNK